MLKKFLFIGLLAVGSLNSYAQFLMDMVDTTTETGRGMLSIYKKIRSLKI